MHSGVCCHDRRDSPRFAVVEYIKRNGNMLMISRFQQCVLQEPYAKLAMSALGIGVTIPLTAGLTDEDLLVDVVP